MTSTQTPSVVCQYLLTDNSFLKQNEGALEDSLTDSPNEIVVEHKMPLKGLKTGLELILIFGFGSIIITPAFPLFLKGFYVGKFVHQRNERTGFTTIIIRFNPNHTKLLLFCYPIYYVELQNMVDFAEEKLIYCATSNRF